MQAMIAKYGHMSHYALDDYPNDGIEVMLKGLYTYGKNRIIQ